ncbi:hypothetical protein ACT7C1_15930 [Bacillus paranthracis]
MLDKEIFVEVPDEETGEIQQYLLTPAKKKKSLQGGLGYDVSRRINTCCKT